MLTSSSPTNRKTSSLAAATSIAPGIDHEQGAEKLARAVVGGLAMRERQQDQRRSTRAPSRAKNERSSFKATAE